jgi:hypothetical protein
MSSIEVYMRRVGQSGSAVLVVGATDVNNPVGQDLARVVVVANNIPQANSLVRFDVLGLDLEAGKTYYWSGIYAEQCRHPPTSTPYGMMLIMDTYRVQCGTVQAEHHSHFRNTITFSKYMDSRTNNRIKDG